MIQKINLGDFDNPDQTTFAMIEFKMNLIIEEVNDQQLQINEIRKLLIKIAESNQLKEIK